MELPDGDAPTSKLIEVCGYLLTICGRQSDPYFASIETHMPANNFLGAVMKHHVSPGAMFLDVGANIGVTAAMANAIIPKVKILAIEPSAVAFECLQATMEANQINGELVRACAGSEDGEAAFFEMDFLAGSHIVAVDHPTIHNAQATLPMVTLDTLVKSKSYNMLDLIKIDVEGFESDVLRGMKNINDQFSPLVFMEFNTFTITAYRNMSPRALLDQIREIYGAVFYEDDHRLLKVDTDGAFLGLLHKTMTTGGVTDILFTSSPQRLAALSA